MVHPSLSLDDAALSRECTFETMRASGPGGQHRNKTESGVRVTHRPSGVVAQAFERRSQHENKRLALQRLREKIALHVRSPIDLERFQPGPEVVAILPGVKGGRIGPANERFWPGIATVLDVFVALDCSVRQTAEVLGLSSGGLSRLLLSSPEVTARVNELRTERGLRPLRS